MALRGGLRSGLAAYSIRLQYPFQNISSLRAGAASPSRVHSPIPTHETVVLAPRECLLSICYQTDQVGWEVTRFLVAA